MRKKFENLVYSFPLQLVFHHVRRNLALVIIWILFVITITGGIGKIYGIHYLYLDPEYIHQVGFMSFFMVGLAFGNFTMAYHITCYILDSHRFAFVGILERPFAKFSLNNSVIPLIALVIYMVLIIRFQSSSESISALQISIHLMGLLSGVLLMCAFFFVYFKVTNKDIFKFLAGSVDKRLRKASLSRERMMNRYTESRKKSYKVTTYLDLRFKVRGCQNLQDFYDREALLKVFDQNHFNSVIIELAFIVLILFLGKYMENPAFQIPAAASSLMMFSILIMLIGAFSYWLRGWGVAMAFGLFILVNVLMKNGVLKGVYQAQGLKYTKAGVPYNIDQLNALNNEGQNEKDKAHIRQILDNWKAKQDVNKPKMVFMCVSGGGQRAALWTVNSLIKADSVIGGGIMDQTVLITGASGGIIGAAYYRELIRRAKLGQKIPSRNEMLTNIGKDNLNAVIFSLLVNDVFFRVRKIREGEEVYTKDRGFVFERNLNRNLGGVFDLKLSEYREPEDQAEIPMMLLSPVIANDGRKLYVSPHSFSFMNVNTRTARADDLKIRGIDFKQLFQEHGAEELSFTTALRMSASFPYITPTISLPSDPMIEIMDAGISDNYGVNDAVQFVSVFREWIHEHTSGVVFLIIRDTRKISPIEPQSNPTLVERIAYPIASVYKNLANIQDINNDTRIRDLKLMMEVPVQTVELEYNTYTNITEEYLLEAKALERKQLERASLSWHLTTREKQNIIDNIRLENNQRALRKLDEIFDQTK